MPAHSIVAGILRLIAVLVVACASVGCQGTAVVTPAELIHQKLNNPITCDFRKARFDTVIAHFRETSGFNIVVSWHAVQYRYSMSEESPITIEHFSGRLKSALRLVLRQIDGGNTNDPLDVFIDDEGIILISSRSDLNKYALSTRIYDVSDLCGKSGDDAFTDTEAVELAITKCALRRENWESNGVTVNSIRVMGNKAFICASREDHARISQVLAALRAPPATLPIWFTNDPYDGLGVEARSEPSDSVKEKLRVPISCNFEAKCLKDVIEVLSKTTGVKMAPDWKTLNRLDVSEDTPVTLKLTRIPADHAINLLLDQLSFADQFNPIGMRFEGETLVISSRQELRCLEDVGICDVSDFMDDKPQDPPNARLFALTEAIERLVGAPEEWQNSGGGASQLTVIRNKMFIRTYSGQRRAIEKILAAFRAPPGGPPVILDNHD